MDRISVKYDYLSDHHYKATIFQPDSQVLIKQKLEKQVFVGYYQDKRLFEPPDVYRDVIVIRDDEKKLKHTIDLVLNHAHEYYGVGAIIPITKVNNNGDIEYALWTSLSNATIGTHWFIIEKVRFVEERVIELNIKCLREYKQQSAKPRVEQPATPTPTPVAKKHVVSVATKLDIPVATKLNIPVSTKVDIPVAGDPVTWPDTRMSLIPAIKKFVVSIAGKIVNLVTGRFVTPAAGKPVVKVVKQPAGPAAGSVASSSFWSFSCC